MKIQIVSKEDRTYPSCFKDLSQKPSVVYYMGDISLFEKKCIAIIGAREASTESIEIATNYGKYLAEQGYIIVNGIARGIDQAAIKGVIDAGGKAVLVMPCGLDCIYPASAKYFIDEVLRLGGCVISEYPEGTQPQKFTFLQRDRLQAAVANKVVVISAEEKSGTMTTVDYALRLNKPVACIYNNASGNRKLINSHKGTCLYNKDNLFSFVTEPISVQMSLFS